MLPVFVIVLGVIVGLGPVWWGFVEITLRCYLTAGSCGPDHQFRDALLSPTGIVWLIAFVLGCLLIWLGVTLRREAD